MVFELVVVMNISLICSKSSIRNRAYMNSLLFLALINKMGVIERKNHTSLDMVRLLMVHIISSLLYDGM